MEDKVIELADYFISESKRTEKQKQRVRSYLDKSAMRLNSGRWKVRQFDNNAKKAPDGNQALIKITNLIITHQEDIMNLLSKNVKMVSDQM